MADQTFIEATMEEVQDPDAWDAGGAALGGSEEAWKQFGILLAKKNAGTLDASMALTLDKVAKYVAAVAETLSTRVASINVPAMTPEEQRLKAFFANLAQQTQRVSQDTGLVLDEIAAGSNSAASRLTASAARLFLIGGVLLSALQVAMAYRYDGVDEGTKVFVGALAGLFIGGPAGAAGGSVIGVLLGSVLVTVGAPVSVAGTAALVAVLGAISGGYCAGKYAEDFYTALIRPTMDSMVEAGGAAHGSVDVALSDALASIGRFDGTWLQDLDATAEQYARRRRPTPHAAEPPLACPPQQTPWRDGTTHLVMSPLEFMQRLAALVPRPRLHLIRFHGVLAPNAKLRALVVPQGPPAHAKAPTESAAAAECEVEPVQARLHRISWARLLKRVFDIDMQHCPNCGGGELKIIAAILERTVIEKILDHLGLDPQPPPKGRAREPRPHFAA